MALGIYLLLGAAGVILLVASLLMRRSPPMVRIFIFLLSLALGGVTYALEEFVFNKGPDDSGAMSYAQTVIFEKRPSYGRVIRLLSFEKNSAQPNSGIYRFHYQTDDHEGTLIINYDGNAGKFTSSEIVDPK